MDITHVREVFHTRGDAPHHANKLDYGELTVIVLDRRMTIILIYDRSAGIKYSFNRKDNYQIR